MGSLNATTTECHAKANRRRSSIITGKDGIEEMKSPKKEEGKRCRRSTTVPQLAKLPVQTMKLKKLQKKIYPDRSTYEALRSKLHRKWKRERFEKNPEESQDNSVIDLKIDHEVSTRISEGVEYWERLARDMGVRKQYDIDYLICLIPRKLGEPISEQLLIKWTNFPCPTWESRSTVTAGYQLSLFKQRQESLDFVELNLRSSLGDDRFERLYPLRYLEYESGRGNDGYVENQRALYKNHLRSIEWRWNVTNRKSGQPLIYIEDWTDEPEDSHSLLAFEYNNYLTQSEGVKNILQQHNKQLDYKKCGGGHCSTCAVQSKKGKDAHCCGLTYSVDIDENGKVTRNYEERVREHTVNVECTTECDCGRKCKNKALSNGRQSILCLFREIGKGWGVRSMQELPCASFVGEYTGEICVDSEGLLDTDRNYVYEFPLALDVTDDDGNTICSPLIISAAQKGNETRFFNHSCQPNMEAKRYIVERHGLWYYHLGFVTTRKIRAGEELTFGYFPNDDDGASIRQMFGACRCGSMKCRSPPQTNDVTIKEENENEEDEEKSILVASRDSSRTRKRSRKIESSEEESEEETRVNAVIAEEESQAEEKENK